MDLTEDRVQLRALKNMWTYNTLN